MVDVLRAATGGEGCLIDFFRLLRFQVKLGAIFYKLACYFCVYFSFFLGLGDFRRPGLLLCVEILMLHGPSIRKCTLIGRQSLYPFRRWDQQLSSLAFPRLGSLLQRVDPIRPREGMFSFHLLLIQAKNRKISLGE